MFIDQLYHSKSFSCLVYNVTRTSHAYDMSKIWDSSCCPAETIRFMQTGRQADSLDLCPSLDSPSWKNKLSHNCLLQDPFHRVWVSCVVSLVALVCLMPPKNQFILEQTKAFLTEQQRLRTERRLVQLRQDQRELELREVLVLFSFIWVLGIVLFFARLYLGPSL